MRRGQSLSGVLILVVTLTILVVIIVTTIVANAQFMAIFQEHQNSRSALLVASRLSDAPKILLDTGREGEHKGMLDSRKLDLLNRTQNDSMPMSAFFYCYNWRAFVNDTQTGKAWEFGAINPVVEKASGGVHRGGKGYQGVGSATGLGESQSFMLPVTIVNYIGNRLMDYTFGTLTVSAWRNDSQCTDENDKEKQYEKAIELIGSVSSAPVVTPGVELPYEEPIVTVPGADYKYVYRRCENLSDDEIAAHFSGTYLNDIKFGLKPFQDTISARIESSAKTYDVDSNLVRAMLLVKTGFSPAAPYWPSTQPAMDGFVLGLANYRDSAQADNAGDCTASYVAYANVSGGYTKLQDYIRGTAHPSDYERGTVTAILQAYDGFSACQKTEMVPP